MPPRIPPMPKTNKYQHRVLVLGLIIALVGYWMYTMGRPAPPPPPPPACPTCSTDVQSLINIPLKFRQKNWAASDGSGGSCVHASMLMLLRWQGQFETAQWWRENFEGGENWGELIQKLEAANLRWAGGCFVDSEFLEWACRNRLGAVIEFTTGPIRHAVVLVDLTPQYAVILDNNHPRQHIFYSRESFNRIWRQNSFACAFTLVYAPPPPWPSDPN